MPKSPMERNVVTRARKKIVLQGKTKAGFSPGAEAKVNTSPSLKGKGVGPAESLVSTLQKKYPFGKK